MGEQAIVTAYDVLAEQNKQQQRRDGGARQVVDGG